MTTGHVAYLAHQNDQHAGACPNRHNPCTPAGNGPRGQDLVTQPCAEPSSESGAACPRGGSETTDGGLQNRNARFDSSVPRLDEHGDQTAPAALPCRSAHAADASVDPTQRHADAQFVHTPVHTDDAAATA